MLTKSQKAVLKSYTNLRIKAAESLDELRKAMNKHVDAELLATRSLRDFVDQLEFESASEIAKATREANG